MAAIEPNYTRWDFNRNTNCIVESGNPTVGFGGGTVFQRVTEQNDQTTSCSITEDGQYNLFVDDTITLVGGATKDGGTCFNIVGKNGDVTITAERNGDIKIKGSNILIDADDNINITSRKSVTIKGSNSIFFDTPNLNTNAMTGNLAPRSVTFGGLVFRGTKVGANAISDAFTGGALESVQSVAQGKALEAAKQLKTLSGSIDTGALASQASELGGQLQNQLSSIDTSGLSNALSNFGGF